LAQSVLGYLTNYLILFVILLFGDVVRRRLIIRYRRFGTTYRSHIEGSSSARKISITWVL